MTQPEIILHDETQLVDWGESRAGGPWIKLRLSDPDLLDQFRSMDTATLKKTGHILHCTLADGDIARLAESEPEPEKPQHGPFWRDLIAAGFFRSPPVLKAIGPETQFEDWIRSRPSVLDGNYDTDPETGEIRNEVCHVRRVSEGSGTATKPPYFAVPMTHEQHAYQHQHGEVAVLAVAGIHKDPEGAAEWFARKADQYRTEWASKNLAHKLKPGCQSRGEVSPDQVREWLLDNDLWQYLPERLRR